MDNNEVLGHLLKIESEAAKLVIEAQAEADRRITEAEKHNRAVYEEQYRRECERLECELNKSKELVREQYRKELEFYKEEISSIHVDIDRFSALLDKLVIGG
jgi:phage host-nuclease inhibitor protein Gam